MSPRGRKSPQRAANDLTVLLRTVLCEDRFPVDAEALAREVSRNHEDPIATIRGVDIPGFEGMLRARKRKPGWHILYRHSATLSWTRTLHPLRTSSVTTCCTAVH